MLWWEDLKKHKWEIAAFVFYWVTAAIVGIYLIIHGVSKNGN